MKTKFNYTFGDGKQAVTIEAISELQANKEYIKIVESKGSESDWDFNLAYKKAIAFVKRYNGGLEYCH